ncbi:MAG: hypothetical protein LBT40_08025 [Deltaproteobacteria bacterium]|nr:hypothetical protein [Deltaproteobacteria bacterium]
MTRKTDAAGGALKTGGTGKPEKAVKTDMSADSAAMSEQYLHDVLEGAPGLPERETDWLATAELVDRFYERAIKKCRAAAAHAVDLTDMDGRTDSSVLCEPVRKARQSADAVLIELKPLKALLLGMGHRKEKGRVTFVDLSVGSCMADELPMLKDALLESAETLMKERKRWRARVVDRLAAEAAGEGRELKNGLPYSEERFRCLTKTLRNFLKHFPLFRMTVVKPLPWEDPDFADMARRPKPESRVPR